MDIFTKEQLGAFRKGELQTALKNLSEQLGEEFPMGGTNAELTECILNAQDMLDLDDEEQPGDDQEQPEADQQENSAPDPEADKPEADPVPEATTYHVSAVPKAGFYRCGLFFPHEGVEVELTDKQLERIQADKNLTVQ